MTFNEAIDVLKKDMDLCNFNPNTGEKKSMSEECRKSAEALRIATRAMERLARMTRGTDATCRRLALLVIAYSEGNE